MTHVFSLFFLLLRRPPRSTLFPTRRSSDLVKTEVNCIIGVAVCIHIAPAQGHGQGTDGITRYRHLSFLRNSDTKIIKRSEEHTSELQSRPHLVCRLLLEKKNKLNT